MWNGVARRMTPSLYPSIAAILTICLFVLTATSLLDHWNGDYYDQRATVLWGNLLPSSVQKNLQVQENQIEGSANSKERISNINKLTSFSTIDQSVKGPKLKCSKLACENHIDKLLSPEDHADEDSCCDGSKPPSSGSNDGDVSIGAIVNALSEKLENMKERFRLIRARYENGSPTKLAISVKPTGPRGFTGVMGDVGLSGNPGPQGDQGKTGDKGPQGWQGPQGVPGRRGATGATGEQGAAGAVGIQGPPGAIGDKGVTGPQGSKGLPGATGAPGANGMDGIPGPAGADSGAGNAGLPGNIGPPGAAGIPGNPGAQGNQGFSGTPGAAGAVGNQGPPGPRGPDGIGPSTPVALLTTGSFPEGMCYLGTRTCSGLGIADNLCGTCKPLCKRCSSDAGFILTNKYGLRWGGATFDNNQNGKGSNQARNICLLAKYGSQGTINSVALDSSYATASSDPTVPNQVHWFGNCQPSSAACCTNANLEQGKNDWSSFALGDQCGGNGHGNPVTEQIYCVFDDKALNDGLTPLHQLLVGSSIQSSAGTDESTLQSSNGICKLSITDGDIKIRDQSSQIAWTTNSNQGAKTSPFTLEMGSDGNLVLYNKNMDSLWTSDTYDPVGQSSAVLLDSCKLCIVNGKGDKVKCSCQINGVYKFGDGQCL